MWKNIIAFLPSHGLLTFASLLSCPLQLLRCPVRSWTPPLPCCHSCKVTVPSSPTQEHLTPFSSTPVHGSIPVPSLLTPPKPPLSQHANSCSWLLLLRNQLQSCCVFPSPLFLPVSVALIRSGPFIQIPFTFCAHSIGWTSMWTLLQQHCGLLSVVSGGLSPEYKQKCWIWPLPWKSDTY